jgi:hypothetical protein
MEARKETTMEKRRGDNQLPCMEERRGDNQLPGSTAVAVTHQRASLKNGRHK